MILETQDGFGGTWRTHTYPGIRSDSDLYTFGYRFKPWTGAPIASADKILDYMGEVIDDNDLDRHIRYNHAIASATWSTEDHQWTLKVARTEADTGTSETVYFTANFLWMCQGYLPATKAGLHARMARYGRVRRSNCAPSAVA